MLNINKNECSNILDSRHIVTTNKKIYNIKLVDCGSFKQVYFYSKPKMKNENKKDYSDFNLLKIKPDIGKQNERILKNGSEIEERSIIRSKLQCQRIAKANMEEWKSFITLTFKENITDLKYANKRFRYFIDKVQRVYKDFKYICITEFQKRGATHYHLLTNIPCDSDIIPKRQIKRLYKADIKGYKELEYYDIKYWIDGFSSAEPIKNEPKKVIGYISKYMTKNIDKRLFNHHRYFFSRNLKTPKIDYINLNNSQELEFLTKKIQGKEIKYQNEYINSYDDTSVTFLEFQ